MPAPAVGQFQLSMSLPSIESLLKRRAAAFLCALNCLNMICLEATCVRHMWLASRLVVTPGTAYTVVSV